MHNNDFKISIQNERGKNDVVAELRSCNTVLNVNLLCDPAQRIVQLPRVHPQATTGEWRLMLLPTVQVIRMGILDPMVIVEGTVILHKMVMWAQGQTLVAVAPLTDCHLLLLHPALVIDLRIMWGWFWRKICSCILIEWVLYFRGVTSHSDWSEIENWYSSVDKYSTIDVSVIHVAACCIFCIGHCLILKFLYSDVMCVLFMRILTFSLFLHPTNRHEMKPPFFNYFNSAFTFATIVFGCLSSYPQIVCINLLRFVTA